jgi:hypothetical protein
MAKKSIIKEIIKEELESMDTEHEDETFTPESAAKKAINEIYDSEEKVIDELLASIPRAQGFYLKLYKELRPNEFELKLRIDNYELWSDMELEITNLVRAYTVKSPNKWGSGRYRITVWKEGGVRGPQRPANFFYVDAMEIENKDTLINVPANNSSEDINNQIATLGSLVSIIRQANPTLSPDDIQKSVTDSFQRGMTISANNDAVAAKSNEGMMTGMLGLITALMGNKADPVAPIDPTSTMANMLKVMTAMGIIGNKPNADEGLMKNIAMMKELGIIAGPAKASDPISQLTGLKDIIALVKGISGSDTNPPTTIEKIIDVIGPKIPDIVGRITSTVDGAIELKRAQILGVQAGQPSRAEIEAGYIPTTHNPEAEQMHGRPEDYSFFSGSETPSKPSMATKSTNEPTPATPTASPQGGIVHPLLQELHKIVIADDVTRFGEIKNMTYEMDGGSGELFDSIVKGGVTPDELVKTLMNLGGNVFKEPVFGNKLTKIVHQFVAWAKSPESNGIPAHCVKCNLEFEYESTEFYNNDTKKCTEDYEGIICDGDIILTNAENKPMELTKVEGANIEAIGG